MSQNSAVSSQDSQSSNDGFSTPKKFRDKRLDHLKIEGCKSPSFKIPASPAMQRLGYGTGVGVYLMERSPLSSGMIRSPWAIKKISKIREGKEIYNRRLELEAEILRQLDHPNIIGYRGFGNPTVDESYLAMEKASSCLGDLIDERSEEFTLDDFSPFPAKNIEKVGFDMAKALLYLHEDKRILHGDMKSANVLIFEDFEMAKLCDFGVSRKIKIDGTLEGRYVGTEIWNPMEVILMNRGQKKYPVTSKADIYPFGLTLHEMMSLKPPHFGTAEDNYARTNTDSSTGEDDSSQGNQDFDEGAFDIELAKHLGKRPALPDVDFHESYNFILGIFYCCTEEDPEKRASAKDIVGMFNEQS